LGNRFEFLEGGRECVRETPNCSWPKFFVLRFEVQIMYRACKMLGSFQFAFDESFVITTLAATSVSSLLCQDSTCLRMGSKFRCIRSTPTDTQSIKEKDFECLAKYQSEVALDGHDDGLSAVSLSFLGMVSLSLTSLHPRSS
jgi:hypothetical protein